MNVVVNGLMAKYQKTGKGKSLIILHGWGDSSKTFSELANHLQASYELLVLDMPGFGGSQLPERAWGVEDYAKFVTEWINKLKVEPYAVMGHSFGGIVALELAANQPSFKKLILLASAGIRSKNMMRKKLLRGSAKVGKVPLYLLPKAKRNRVRQKFYQSIGSDSMLLPHMQDTYRRIIDQDMRPEAAKIILPTLLVYGQSDKSTPVSDGQELHKLIKNSHLEVLQAGHFLHQEQAAQLSVIITNFLKD
jgi:pimeloyl-ACP methyl ester carboxylesterase